MTWGNVIAGGSAIIGGVLGSKASKKAAKAQEDAAREAAAVQKYIYDQTRADQAPFREAGLAGQNELLTLLGLTGGNTDSGEYDKYGRDPTLNDLQMDPGYGFRLSEGLKGLDQQAAARGGLISGAALKASMRYGQEMGSKEYMNAFNRYGSNRDARLNPLQSLLGAGQSSTAAIGNAGQNYANGAGEAYMQAGNARASGYMGQANALSRAITGVGNSFQDYLANKVDPNGLW